LLVRFLDNALPRYEINFPKTKNQGILVWLEPFIPPPRNNQDVVAVVTLINAGVDIIKTTQSSWWWEYRLVFECQYGTALRPDKVPGSPITNPILKQQIQDDIDKEIQTLGYILQVLAIHENSRGILGFAVDDPRISDPPFVFQRPEVRGGSEVPPYQPYKSPTTKSPWVRILYFWLPGCHKKWVIIRQYACSHGCYSRTGVPLWVPSCGWSWAWCLPR
jgi:hypothetical protein